MEEKINRLAKIKAIGWTSLIIFGLLTLLLLFRLVAIFLFDSSLNTLASEQIEYADPDGETNFAINQSKAILFISVGFSLLAVIGAIVLTKLKFWGLMLYQSLTIIIIFMLLGMLAYTLSTKPPLNPKLDDPLFRTMSSYQTIEYGMLLILFSWILTRVNIFLSKKVVRMEFRPKLNKADSSALVS